MLPRERRRPDPLEAIFDTEVVPLLKEAPGLRPVAIFEEILDLHRFCSGQVLMLGGPLFEDHG